MNDDFDFDEYVYKSTCLINEHQNKYGDPAYYRCQKCGGSCGGTICTATTKIITPYSTGHICTVNGKNDLYMDYAARPFIGMKCIILKQTKAGLISVALLSNPKKIYSFPQRNIDL